MNLRPLTLALCIPLLGRFSAAAQAKTWQSYYVDSGAPAPVVLGTATLVLLPSSAATPWTGFSPTGPSGAYAISGFGKDSLGDTFNLYTLSGIPTPATPAGYLSRSSPTITGTQNFALNFSPTLLGISPSGDTFAIGIDETAGRITLFQVNPDGTATTIYAFSTTYFDVGNLLPGPMTVDANDDIIVTAYSLIGASSFLPAFYLFVTTGPVPYALPFASSYPAGTELQIQATSSLPITYQWSYGGAPIPQATSSTFSASSGGLYSVTASTTAGTVTLSTVVMSAAPVASTHLVNISCRAFVGTGTSVAIAGFVVSGTANEQVLIRGVGPTLSQFSVSGFLTQPVLTVYNSTGTQVGANTGWGTNSNAAAITAAFASTGAFALPANSADSALLLSLPPGSYTAEVSGMNNGTGDALIEVYEIPAAQ